MSRAAEILSKKQFFKDGMAEKMTAEEIERVWNDAVGRLDQMYDTHPDLPKGVRMHTDNYIFPTAAVYLALKQEKPDVAYEIIEETMRIRASGMGASIQKMSKIPGFKTFFLKLWDPVSHKMFGENSGFKNKFYPKARKEYRMDILECPYNKYLTEQGCPELTVLFCKNDEYTYGHIDGLEFIRTQTLGSGGEKCDFRMVLRK